SGHPSGRWQERGSCGSRHHFALFVGAQWALLSPRQGRVVEVPLLAAPAARRLTEADAVDIWIARWLRIRRKDLVARYGCDPRRLYEIGEETRFPGSGAKAK